MLQLSMAIDIRSLKHAAAFSAFPRTVALSDSVRLVVWMTIWAMGSAKVWFGRSRPTAITVLHILGAGRRGQVGRVAASAMRAQVATLARRVVASVVNVERRVDRSDHGAERKTVGGRGSVVRSSPVTEYSVAALRDVRLPRPALIRSTPVDPAPEPLFDSRAWRLRWRLLFRQTRLPVRSTLLDTPALPTVSGPGSLIPIELGDRLLDVAAVARLDRPITIAEWRRLRWTGSSLGSSQGGETGKTTASESAPVVRRVQIGRFLSQAY